jgi:predicted MFS family arabinose efflux permease
MAEARPVVTATPWSPRVAVFLAAEALSAVGSLATMVAIWGYAVYRFDAGPGELSLYGLAFAVPGVLLGPVAGSVVDRLGPKGTIAASRVLGIVASLLLLTVDTFLSMVLLTVLHGVAMTFAVPAVQSMPPRLVDERHVARTNALVSLTDDLSLVIGPAVAGASIAAFGFRGAFVFDALTYALGLLVLPMVRLRAVAGPAAAPGAARVRDVFAGWALVARVPVLRWTVACTAAVFSLYGLALLAEPLYVRDVLERSATTFAALQTSFGICLVAGGLIAARMGDRLASFRWVAVGVIGSGAAAVVYLGTRSVVIAFAGVALWGMATAAISGPSRTVLQRSTPEHAHGRVMAVDLVAGNAAMLIGIVIGGPVIAAVGVPGAAFLFGSLAAGLGVAALVADRRSATVTLAVGGSSS